jgi:hypothetical protein
MAQHEKEGNRHADSESLSRSLKRFKRCPGYIVAYWIMAGSAHILIDRASGAPGSATLLALDMADKRLGRECPKMELIHELRTCLRALFR